MIPHKSFLAFVVRKYDEGLVCKGYLPSGARTEFLFEFDKFVEIPEPHSWVEVKLGSNGKLAIEPTERRPLYSKEELREMIETLEILDSWDDLILEGK